jgi:hypothetical protein
VWLDDTQIAILSDLDASIFRFVETDHLGMPRAVIHPGKNRIVWRPRAAFSCECEAGRRTAAHDGPLQHLRKLQRWSRHQFQQAPLTPAAVTNS